MSGELKSLLLSMRPVNDDDMTSLLDALAVLKDASDQDRKMRLLMDASDQQAHERRLMETLQQALADEERRKAELSADAVARRLRSAEPELPPAEPEPPPAEPEPPPRRKPANVPANVILSRLQAGESMTSIKNDTGASRYSIRQIKNDNHIPDAKPGKKARVE